MFLPVLPFFCLKVSSKQELILKTLFPLSIKNFLITSDWKREKKVFFSKLRMEKKKEGQKQKVFPTLYRKHSQ